LNRFVAYPNQRGSDRQRIDDANSGQNQPAQSLGAGTLTTEHIELDTNNASHNIADDLEAMVLRGISNTIREKVDGIRDPETGEFPVVLVRGHDLDHLSIEVSGSDAIVRFVADRLGVESTSTQSHDVDTNAPATADRKPTAFLCYATEDKPLARRIAEDLQAAGVDTFFDE
jgi:hypothetical protein